jgi:anti-anti-sigma factor
MLRSKSEHRDSVVVLALGGQLDALTSNDMEKLSHSLRETGVRKLVMDLQDLSLIDSVGMCKINSLFRYTRQKNGELRVANLRHQPKVVFEVLNSNRHIKVFDTVDQAVASFQQN